MKKYNSTDLATYIKAIIDKYYTDPEYLYTQLKRNINGKIKANNRKDLTADELKEKGLIIASSIIDSFNMITIKYIERKLSEEVINEAKQGIELTDYKDYLLKSAQERVRELINSKYKANKARIRKSRTKK